MAWLSSNNFTPDDFLHADDLNNLANDDRSWGGNVNGGGYTLSNVTLSGVQIEGSGQVTSVFGRSGDVVAQTGDYTAAQVGAVPVTRRVNAGVGLSGGGPLSGDVTLTALVPSVFGRTGPITLLPSDISGATGVLNTRQVLPGAGLTGGGPLSADVTLSVTPDSTNQQLQILSAGALVGTRHALNFVAGLNVSLSISDDPTDNRVNITVSSTGGSGGMVDPTTTLGDLIVRGSVTVNRLPVGTDGQVLTADSTQMLGMKWAPSTGGGVPPTRQIIAGPGLSGGGTLASDVTLSANVLTVEGRTGNVILTPTDITNAGGLVDPTTTKGDMIARATAGTTRLPVGADGYVLTADSTQTLGVRWALLGAGGGAVQSVFGRTGAVIAVSGDYTAAMVTNAVDTTGSYSNPPWLTSLAWTKITGSPAFLVDPTTTLGDLIVRGSTTATRLGVGINGYVLTADSTQPLGMRWAQATGGGTGVQTPWASNIDAAGFTLSNIPQINGPSAASLILNSVGQPILFSIGGTQAASLNLTVFNGPRTIGAVAGTSGFPAALQVTNSTGSTWAMQMDPGIAGTNNLSFLLNSGGIATLTSAGRFGIGTSAPDSRLTLSSNSAALPAVLAGTILHAGGADADNPRIVVDSFGGTSNLTLRSAGGTAAAPTPSAVNVALGTIAAFGRGATGYSASARAAIVSTAAETWTDTAQGTYMTFQTTAIGTTAAGERMRIDSTGNVGIGTTAPQYPLDVGGGIHCGSLTLSSALKSASGVGTIVITSTDATGPLQATINLLGAGSPRLAIQCVEQTVAFRPITLNEGGGNVGIGTTAPDYPLTFAAANGAKINLVQGSNYGFGIGAAVLQIFSQNTGTRVGIGYGSSGSFTETLSVVGSNVGIGTTAPNGALDVCGVNGIYIASSASGDATNNNYQLFRNTADGYLHFVGFQPNASGYVFYTQTTGQLAALTITNAGLVGIAKPSPAYALDVTGDVNCTGAFRVNGTAIGSGGTTLNFQVNSGALGASATLNISGGGATTVSAIITGPGVASYAVNSSSDRRLKQNIQPLAGGMPIIEQLLPVRAEWNGLGGKKAGEPIISIIAQELQAVIPDAVYSYRGKLMPEDAQDIELLGFEPMAIVAHLILAVKQLERRIRLLQKAN